MLGEARRCQIDLAFGDALGERAVEVRDRTLHAEQRAQPLHFLCVTPLLPRQLPRDEIEDVDRDAKLKSLVAGDQRRDVVAEEIGDRLGQLDRCRFVLHV
ncbi:hypothetical protein ACVWYH_000549 [Bradyrhizobium sp. GM24.11]